MNKKVKSYYHYESVTSGDGSSHTVLVYGEVSDDKFISGFAPVTFTRKGRIIKSVGEPVIVNSEFRSPVKKFNMGFAICNSSDTFDVNTGIKVAKKRFAKSPMTTQNSSFLTEDMLKAIVDNELNYILNNIDHFLAKTKY